MCIRYSTSVLFACLIACVFGSSVMGAPQPNIVLIMADDVGLGDIGAEHRRRTGTTPLAPTPTIDALAEQGMWFRDAHSPTALCSPSRYSVMSGNQTYRSYAPWGVWGSFRETPFRESDATLGTVTKAAGYSTAFIGKWHLGGDFHKLEGQGIYRGADRGEGPLNVDMNRWVGNGPPDWGFDYSFTVPTGVQGPVYLAYENGNWSPLASDSRLINYNERTAKEPRFVSDKGPGWGDSAWDATELNARLAQRATDFIRRKSGEQPFFLCYWTSAVHVPHTPPAELEGEAVKGTTPSRHLDMMRVLDWEVAQIVSALKETGEYGNTLIVFTSDNGGLEDRKAAEAGHSSSGGWRGHKNQAYEGGHRVPLIAVWPGVVASGSESDALVTGADLVATFAAAAGATLAEDQAMDSMNLLPLLQGSPKFEQRRELLLQAGSNKQLMLRQDQWKLIIQSNAKLTRWEPIALFDLAANPAEEESQNLIDRSEQAPRVQRMLARYQQIMNSGIRTAPL